jgi:serine/threonine protein kinase
MDKIIKEYLSHEDIKSLNNSYKNSNYEELPLEIKNNVIRKIHNDFIMNTFADLFNIENIDKDNNIINIGGGTQGYVLKFKANNIQAGILKLEEELENVKRIKRSNENIPNEIAIKVQLLYTRNKHWEERVLREEYILNKINEISENGPNNVLRKAIPRFYYGFTIKFSDYIRVRLTFMELIDIRDYKTLEVYLQKYKLKDEGYKNIKDLVEKLWKFGISHNDLSIRNILIDGHNDIKLIDFGLSQMINPVNSFESYKEYFKNVDKNEQNGSNVEKLEEIFNLIN